MIFIIFLLWITVIFLLLHKHSNIINTGFTVIIAIAVAASILSYSYIGFGFLRISFKTSMTIAATIPLMAIFFLLVKHGSKSTIAKVKNNKIQTQPLFVFLSSVLLISIAFFLYSKKWGAADAVSIWTLRARFLTVGNFADCSLHGLPYTHPDYPLMLPSLISLAWRSLQVASPVVPAMISYITCICVLAALFFSFYDKNDYRPATAITIITTITFFYPIGFLQYADTLLALFILLSFVVAENAKKTDDNLYAFIAGLLTCSCGWVKNEGLAFAVIFTFIFLITNKNKKNIMLCFLTGTIIPLTVIIVYKTHYVPANDLHLAQTSLKAISRDRLLNVAKLFGGFILLKSQLPFLLTIGVVANRSYFFSWRFMILGSMICCYFYVFLVTPYDVTWHISTSADRLIHQVIPAFYYTLFLTIRPKEAAYQ